MVRSNTKRLAKVRLDLMIKTLEIKIHIHIVLAGF